MTDSDIVILEFLADVGIALPPTPIHYTLEKDHDISYSTVRRRLDKLDEEGYVELDNEAKKYYQITQTGVSYLEQSILSDDRDDDSDQ